MASIDLHSTFDNTTSGYLYSNVTKKDDDTKVIRLNVGGARYEVSRWLIDMYPETMLARDDQQRMEQR
jgi:hypothetical protein